MTLYYVWWEDTTQTADRYEQRQTAVHEAGFGGGDAGNGGSGGPSDPNGKGGGNPHSTPPPPTPPQPKPKKEKKPKTVNQMARAVSWLLNCLCVWICSLSSNPGDSSGPPPLYLGCR